MTKILKVKMHCKYCPNMAYYEAYWSDMYGIQTKEIHCEHCGYSCRTYQQDKLL